MKHRPPTAATESPIVWDAFIRLFHWGLVTCMVLNLMVLEAGETAHEWVGYVASALVLARIVWGFVGSRHARFTSFFPTPSRLAAHLRALRRGDLPWHEGHNPLGALMMLALMCLTLALGLTGWMQTTDRWFGEEWLMTLHERLSDELFMAAGIHTVAAILIGRLERVQLVRAMITGRKRRY